MIPTRRTLALLIAGLTVLCSKLARADEPAGEPKGDAKASATHWELTFGFLGGLRDESVNGFVFGGGAAGDLAGGAALVSPFSSAPYANAVVSGPACELRTVIDHLRITLGVQKPFAQTRLGEGSGLYELQGAARSVSVRSLSLWDLRLGLGGEVAFAQLTPFVDLLGDMQWVSTELTVDGAAATYRAWSFGYSVRAGVRIRLSEHLFVAPSAELGLVGPERYGAQLMVGLRLPGGV